MNTIRRETTLPSGQRILVMEGDLTQEAVDAIVNAANERLQHGGGVAGAIVRKGGQVIQEESNRIGHVPTGSAAITRGGSLPARYVIHAVGPIWGSVDEDNKLISAIRSSLLLAEQHKLSSISFPAISAGIFGFPKERCADLLLETARAFLADHPASSLREVRFCLFDQPTLEAFIVAFDQLFGGSTAPKG
ncbi:MAG: macro domain-containing protein [Candidatus Tectomicrobia bacterium]|uniref:Macro domain-containing protein n=1 Tax=Tectimicrobiota bacterium TaxID=2528274 RepID=A0A932FWU8_UNCTE|nr:macro domain-containing protein [Candidatus Tectomicrobia bacterium]